MSKKIVLAVGGNSLIKDPTQVSVQSQYAAACETAEMIVEMIKEGHKLVVSHGNGPQVGFYLRRVEIAQPILHSVPLDSCVSGTQGAIGYNLQMALHNEMLKKGISKTAVTVITQTIVDAEDPSFNHPSKPIGSFLSKEEAEHHRDNDGWHIVEDAGRGYRRVVPSPMAIEIVELEAIKTLIQNDMLVIAAGGGGIPVIKHNSGSLKGCEAVIDKDFAAGLLAHQLNADLYIISTAVEKVCIRFGQPDQETIGQMTVKEAERYIDEGHFAPGSMLPKIQAMITFVKNTGKTGIITNPQNLKKALSGETGTRIIA
jgi:carbamate kinase